MCIRDSTTNREKPELPTVSAIWNGAEFNEREVYDYYGIRFIGHPDMRRLFLRDDWVGYPSVSYTHLDVYKRQAMYW